MMSGGEGEDGNRDEAGNSFDRKELPSNFVTEYKA